VKIRLCCFSSCEFIQLFSQSLGRERRHQIVRDVRLIRLRGRNRKIVGLFSHREDSHILVELANYLDDFGTGLGLHFPIDQGNVEPMIAENVDGWVTSVCFLDVLHANFVK